VRRRPQLGARTFTRAIALREAIYDVCSAQAAGRTIPAGSLDVISQELAIAATHRRSGYQSRTGFGWEWQPAEEALDRPLWPVAISATDLLTSHRIEFLRECALETCGWLFLDTSRNRTRRWCDMRTCGNRAKVRRFYARARKGA
jgi:predicted RNA-binding Zn ribbon-like protein